MSTWNIHSILSCIPLTHPENLFAIYYEKGDLIAKNDMDSVEDQDDPLTNANRYVLADITSFFTLLVGIYFPSVTGENLYFSPQFFKNLFNQSMGPRDRFL